MGQFNTHGGYFAPKGYFKVNEGGSHEENPNGGVQIGVDPQGTPNMLEEGEPVYNDYVFSDNIEAESAILEKYHIPKKYAGKLYSEIADALIEEAEERPNDPISNNGVNAMLTRLAQAQEEQKQIQQQKEVEDELAQMSPEELQMLEQMIAQQAAQEQVPQDAMPVEGMPMQETPEQGMAPQMMAPEQAVPQMPMMACGGHLLRRYDAGGNLDDELPPARTLFFNPETASAYAQGYGPDTVSEYYGGALDPSYAVAFPGRTQAWVDAEVGPNSIKKQVSRGISNAGREIVDTVGDLDLVSPVGAVARMPGEIEDNNWLGFGLDATQAGWLSPIGGAIGKAGSKIGGWVKSELSDMGETAKTLLRRNEGRIRVGAKAMEEARSNAYKLARELGEAQDIVRRGGVPDRPLDDILRELQAENSKLPLDQRIRVEDVVPQKSFGELPQAETPATSAESAAPAETQRALEESIPASETPDVPNDTSTQKKSDVPDRKSKKEKKPGRGKRVIGWTLGSTLGGGAAIGLGEALLEGAGRAEVSDDLNNWLHALDSVSVVPADSTAVNSHEYGGGLNMFYNAGQMFRSATTPFARLGNDYTYGPQMWDNSTNSFQGVGTTGFIAPIAKPSVGYDWNTGVNNYLRQYQATAGVGPTGYFATQPTAAPAAPAVAAPSAAVESTAAPAAVAAPASAAAFASIERPLGLAAMPQPHVTNPGLNFSAYGVRTNPWNNKSLYPTLPSSQYSLFPDGLEPELTDYAGMARLGALSGYAGAGASTTSQAPADSGTTPSGTDENYAGNMSALPVFPMYAGGIGSALLALGNVMQEPTKFHLDPMHVNTPYGRIELQDQVYNPIDQNRLENQVIAQGNATARALQNSGLGPSTAAALLASDAATQRARGEGFLQAWDANNQRRNQVIAANNAAEAQKANFEFGVDAARASAINQANMMNHRYDLLLQQLNNEAENAKFASVSQNLSNALEGLAAIGRTNATLNQVNSNRTLYDMVGPDLYALYKHKYLG